MYKLPFLSKRTLRDDRTPELSHLRTAAARPAPRLTPAPPSDTASDWPRTAALIMAALLALSVYFLVA